jgi:hypothetical protein
MRSYLQPGLTFRKDLSQVFISGTYRYAPLLNQES